MEKCFDINLGLYYEIQMEIVYYPMRVKIVKCKYRRSPICCMKGEEFYNCKHYTYCVSSDGSLLKSISKETGLNKFSR